MPMADVLDYANSYTDVELKRKIDELNVRGRTRKRFLDHVAAEIRLKGSRIF